MTDREKVLKGLECCSVGADQSQEWNSLTARKCGKCPYNKPGIACTRVLAYDALELLKAEEAKPLRCGGCSWFTQTQESGVGYCSLKNHEREVFDTEYCSWGAWTAKEG